MLSMFSIRFLMEKWQVHERRKAQLKMLDNYHPAQVDELAQDFGLSSYQFREWIALDRKLLKQRMVRAGIDDGRIDPAALDALEQRCALCVEQARCRRDLQTKGDAIDWADYCPNDPAIRNLSCKVTRAPRGRWNADSHVN